MQTRAKFRCVSKTEYQTYYAIQLVPVVGGSVENDRFYGSTPGGELSLSVNKSSETALMFTPGKEFYIDIIPVDLG